MYKYTESFLISIYVYLMHLQVKHILGKHLYDLQNSLCDELVAGNFLCVYLVSH